MNYVVYAPSFDPNNGGSIFMHELVHALNGLGERALLWPMAPIFRVGYRARLKQLLAGQRESARYEVSPVLDTPVASSSDLTKDTVVVYPEIVRGNPLGVRNVVRWLLYKPGVRHPYKFGKDEMFFRVGEMFDLPDVTGGAPDLYLYKTNPCYYDRNRSQRSGVCFLVRKGEAKARIPETADAIQIDGRTHEEIAEIFSACHTFYSYDEATMYSQFAAVSGCLSIVLPGPFAASRDDWVKQFPIARYGVAYGTAPSEIEHAKSTRHLLVQDLRNKEAEGVATVRRFVQLTHSRFAASN